MTRLTTCRSLRSLVEGTALLRGVNKSDYVRSSTASIEKITIYTRGLAGFLNGTLWTRTAERPSLSSSYSITSDFKFPKVRVDDEQIIRAGYSAVFRLFQKPFKITCRLDRIIRKVCDKITTAMKSGH
ncbi:hypothetical protein AcW1_004589 [Taiwanofungus camphoratus]|nr:hypothetical protein AcV5_000975 [Antrodia cinnamomea]KAI0959909.1 hypothetical protein AcW1_004589 [Antrodia cinnamomea]